MEQDSINLEEFCRYYSTEISFVHALHDSGLITVTTDNERYFIPIDEMPRLERFARLHYELDINLEGLETINYLLEKMELLQQQLHRLESNLTSA